MDPATYQRLATDLLVVLAGGLLTSSLCKQFGISTLVGYLLLGAVIGQGGLGLVSQQHHELEYLARAGALLLLFSIGIEFSPEELVRLGRFFFVGGSVQMALVVTAVVAVCLLLGTPPGPAALFGSAVALSSTVLVFRALAELGQTALPHGRRAIGILLFQDVALVPLILLIPLLTGAEEKAGTANFAIVGLKSVFFVAAIAVARRAIARWIIPAMAATRSTEVVVLFALTVLGGASVGANAAGLPPALGAFAAGLMLSGNRLTTQVDALVLPYRESFAAVFFVTLGTLLRPATFLDEPVLLSAALLAVLVLKTIAAAVALRLTGLPWRSGFGMGLGLAQLGEFSFVLLSEGVVEGVVSQANFNRILFIALGTLVVTPQLLRFGLRWATQPLGADLGGEMPVPKPARALREAVVVGIGVIGRQMASQLETLGIDVCSVDLSPVNLHPFAQQGMRTVAGDARDEEVLSHAGAEHCCFILVAVPDDRAAVAIVAAFRRLNRRAVVVARCRYKDSVAELERAGANAVVSEETETSATLRRMCEKMVWTAQESGAARDP